MLCSALCSSGPSGSGRRTVAPSSVSGKQGPRSSGLLDAAASQVRANLREGRGEGFQELSDLRRGRSGGLLQFQTVPTGIATEATHFSKELGPRRSRQERSTLEGESFESLKQSQGFGVLGRASGHSLLRAASSSSPPSQRQQQNQVLQHQQQE